jgi:hypothetical protein
MLKSLTSLRMHIFGRLSISLHISNFILQTVQSRVLYTGLPEMASRLVRAHMYFWYANKILLIGDDVPML